MLDDSSSWSAARRKLASKILHAIFQDESRSQIQNKDLKSEATVCSYVVTVQSLLAFPLELDEFEIQPTSE